MSMDLEEAVRNTAFKERRNLTDTKLKAFCTQYNFTMDELEYLKVK
jgi:hypothetical protein